MIRSIVSLIVSLFIIPTTVNAQNIITPEQAVQAVRDFWGDQTITGVADGPHDEGDTGRLGIGYDVEVANSPKAGNYWVLATSGTLIYFRLEFSHATSPVISQTEAKSNAESFLMLHYPAFGQGQWRFQSESLTHIDSEYHFVWSPILNAYGVLGPYEVQVDIDGFTGSVVGYSVPWDTTITGPTVPQITQQQAQLIATPYAAYDLNEVPFSEIELQCWPDLVGIQRLTYTFRQIPPSTEEDPGPDPWGVCVDAVTGEITGVETPLGGIGSNKKMRKLPPLPRHVRLLNGTSGDKEVRSVVFPIIEKERTWIRVELMRGFGARVKADRQGATVRIDGKMLEAKQLGAKWRDYGWWVPLRRTVDALGWKVAWDSSAKAAHVAKPETK